MYYNLISSMQKNNLIRNGLKLYVDAGKSISYPGTGTLWSDISGNGNNGTLTNGPIYSTNNGGVIQFDGTNDFVSFGISSFMTGLINMTASIWINPLSIPTTTYGYYSPFSRYGGVNGWEIIYFTNQTFHFGGREISGAGNYIGVTTNNSYPINNWYNIVGTKSKNSWSIYVNGIFQKNIIQGTGTVGFSAQNLNIANEFNAIYSNIRVSNALIYNRALSENEVLQNYNFFKSRF